MPKWREVKPKATKSSKASEKPVDEESPAEPEES
jgi:hypothetical protein